MSVMSVTVQCARVDAVYRLYLAGTQTGFALHALHQELLQQTKLQKKAAACLAGIAL